MYLALYQHGNVYKHIMQLLDAAFKTDNVFVSGFDLTQGLFRDPRVHNLQRVEVFRYHTDALLSHLSLGVTSIVTKNASSHKKVTNRTEGTETELSHLQIQKMYVNVMKSLTAILVSISVNYHKREMNAIQCAVVIIKKKIIVIIVY